MNINHFTFIMARYYRRRARRSYRARPVKRMRYSAECSLIRASFKDSVNLVHIPIAPLENVTTAIFGMRKAKNFTLTLASNVPTSIGNAAIVEFALVYWPQVYANAPTTYIPTLSDLPASGNAVSMYEPNQNVIMQGIWTLSESSYRGFSRLARNLNSGDTLMIIMKYVGDPIPANTTINIAGTIKFAIGYN